MSCENCREALETDGEIPLCQSPFVKGDSAPDTELPSESRVGGCLIPPLTDEGQRILTIRTKLIALKDLVDAGTVLEMYEVTIEEMELLATVEEEIKKWQK